MPEIEEADVELHDQLAAQQLNDQEEDYSSDASDSIDPSKQDDALGAMKDPNAYEPDSDDEGDEKAVLQENGELDDRLAAAKAFKEEGNAYFAAKQLDDAIAKYSSAIKKCPKDHEDRAVYFSNRAACRSTRGQYKESIVDCCRALKLQPDYVKAVARRAAAHDALGNVVAAYDDFCRVLELDAGHRAALAGVARLKGPAEEEKERMKEEMMGKLKDLGNSFLGMFGMSLDNFKATKDPSTGNYSISMNR